MKQYETLSLPFTCVKGFFTILEKKEERCMIDLRNVEKTYYSNAGDIHALKKTNLHINAGEIFGIIGLSGAGKSTLIRCINMLEVPTGGQVFVDGQEITLTHKEYELLHFFMVNPSQIFSRDQLLNRIWGYDFEGTTRTVDTHIKTLRQKLGDEGKNIVTLIRSGYKFEVSV